ncbi:sensor histidine kinase [Acidicapsa ligni]|uniref:sensor histidine kinase n=1 Tax=Acidicapsa ligni TaxID=542300 RepID=UPI0021DF56FD|nr:ATP-binding protein [Acidicapsa ligni]
MTTTPIKVVLRRIAGGSASAMLLTLISFRLHFNLSAATSIHLFLVVVIAIRWGLLEASLVSILSVVCLDYFFTEPLFQFYITDSHDWIAILIFEATALLVSSLSNQVSNHARELERRQAQQQKLYELSQHVLLISRDAAVDQQIVDLMRFSLQVKGVALWNAYEMHHCKSGDCDFPDGEVRSVFSLEANEDDLSSGISRRVLRSGTRPIGAILLSGHSLDSASVDAVASLAAVAIERARSFFTEANAEAAKQSEQLRSAILDGLAHAFKSPLTTIRASSSGLLAMKTLSGTEQKLVGLIDRHAGHLSDLATHLLLTAKLDSGDLKVKREEIDVVRLIQNTLAESLQELARHPIDFQLSSGCNAVYADRKLLQMALFQVLDNAAKYSRPKSPVVIVVREEEAELVIRIKNEGSFIPDDEREKVFQRFYRCSESVKSISGTGIGLSVVRRIAEAHRGRTWVESDHVNGTTFAIALPRMAKEKT